jgi:ABC-type branched-subunit amino acid transport system substrate-binding protein
MGTAVGLAVEAHNLDDANLWHRFGDEADLGANEVFIHHRCRAREKPHVDGAVRFQFEVHEFFDSRAKTIGQRIELEVHTSREFVHVAARDRHLPLVPDHTAQHVQRRMRTHQSVTPFPLDRTRHDFAHHRARATFHFVPNEVALLVHINHWQPRESAGVMRLAATCRIERSGVECDFSVSHINDATGEAGQIRVAEVQKLGMHGTTIIADRHVHLPSMRAKSLSRLAVALAALLTVTACTGGGTPTVTSTTVGVIIEPLVSAANLDGVLRIGVLLPTTGPAKALAQPMLVAIDMAVAEINAAGGVFGRPVELMRRDEGTDAVSAATAFAELLDIDRVDVIVGPSSSRIALGLIDGLARRKIPTCSPAATAIDLGRSGDGGFFFRTVPSDRLEALAMAAAISTTGQQSVDIVYPDDDFGTAMAEDIRVGLLRSGTNVLAAVPYNPSATQFTDVAAKVFVTPAPRSIALIGLPDPGAQVLGALRTAGGSGVQIVVNAGLRRADLFETVLGGKPEALDRVRGVSPASWAARPEWTERFKVQPEVGSDSYAAFAYDCTMLLALAATAAKTDEGTVVAANIVPTSLGGTTCFDFVPCVELITEGRNIDFSGASGRLDLLDVGDPQSGRYDLFTFDKSGRDVSGQTTVDVSG